MTRFIRGEVLGIKELEGGGQIGRNRERGVEEMGKGGESLGRDDISVARGNGRKGKG